MGYSTYFTGRIEISPPLNPEEIAFLQKFNETRRMDRDKGPYFVDGSGDYGRRQDPDVRNFNNPPEGQPGLWCQWMPTEDGTAIEWDEGEKFSNSAEWMKYLVDHFLKPGCLAAAELPFLQANHVCNGTIEAQGEDAGDRWDLIVMNNITYRQDYELKPTGDAEPV